MEPWIGTAAQLSLAAVFLWAGLSKALAVGALADTIGRLGVGSRAAGPAASAVVLAELTAGAGLVVTPGAWWPRALAVALATAFAGAGLVALATGKRVTCNCFGNARPARFGRRQLQLLPVWVGLAALAQWQPAGWRWHDGVVTLAFVLVGLAIARTPRQLRLVSRLRSDRIALAPAYRGRPDDGEVTAS